MSRSGFRNGQLIYPISVVDHDATIDDPVSEDVALLMAWKADETTVYDNKFYIGAGSTYSDVLDDSHDVSVKKSMKTNVNVTAAAGDHIIIVIESSLAEYFYRADINGVEIPFTKTEVTVSGVDYDVYTSDDTYTAGTYNIDINS